VDTGIDLVARERATGDYCAIQCKFYNPAHTLDKADIDSFFTASGKRFATTEGERSFTSRIVVSTTDKWSKHAEKSLENQQIPAIRLRVQDLADSPIDWIRFRIEKPTDMVLRQKKTLRPHQTEAIENVLKGFAAHDRGKLVMACGTGKTFTSLRLAERMTGNAGLVLFLVPSISLLSQTLREWTAEAEKTFHAFAVCSDTKVGRHREDVSVHDLAFPATTDPARLSAHVAALHGDRQMTVIFSTYQSIEVVSEAQRMGLPAFELAVCDEAHRTTGVTLANEDDSAFVRIHNSDFIRARKRLYMTATPRLFADSTKSKAEEAGAELCSMDDPTLFGPEFYRLGFGKAVAEGLLADYKVMVLAVDEKHISRAFQKRLADEQDELKLDDAAKIIGCWNGLSKRLIGEETKAKDPHPMHRAVAFARSIKDSKHLAAMFQQVVDEYIAQHGDDEDPLRCEVKHVDGTFNALARNEKLDWLKQNAEKNACRILSNVHCLSEGVDVPALDSVLFLNPRDSIVDVVQSVGRVMRRAEGKKYGYVILPVGIPADTSPEEALKNNERYKIVWQVLQALRAHDDRFNATVNQIELNKQRPGNIQVIGVGVEGEEGESPASPPTQLPITFPEIEAWRDAIYAKIVIKCGDRRYWEDWAKDVTQIAERHTTRIKALLESGGKAREAFDAFLSGLRENINPAIGEAEAIEMLSQHLITRPVFDALFQNYSFTAHNPVSCAMQGVLDVLEGQALGKEVEAL
jgi:predicted helicase